MDKAAIIAAVMALSNAEFADCNFAVMASYQDGTPIVALNEARKMNPASNLKVITTGMAIESLGPDYRWKTSIGYSGGVSADGTLNGDIFIIGGGNPMLGSDDKEALRIEDEFAAWEALIRECGIHRIAGRVIGDGRWLDGEIQDPTWWYSDLGLYYGTRLSGLNYYENQQDFRVHAGLAEGDSLSISADYPCAPWMSWTFDCTTGASGTGDKLFYYNDLGSGNGTIKGTFAVDKADKTVHFRNNYPELCVAALFSEYLNSKGLHVSGTPAWVSGGTIMTAPGKASASPAIPEPTIIGRTSSPTLLEVARETNRISNNFYAEMLFRTMAKEAKGNCSIKAAQQTIREALDSIVCVGADRKEIIIQDGCGMSNSNILSPKYMCRYLASMTQMPHFKEFFSTLNTMCDGRVHFKTGAITGCRTLCGYIDQPCSDEKIVFSIMVGNSELPTSKIDSLERGIIRMLAR